MSPGVVLLVDPEVEPLEKLFEETLHQVIGEMQVGVPKLECARLEEAAVEVRDTAQPSCRGCAFTTRRVEAAEEQRQQDVGEELALLLDGPGAAIDEKPPLAVEPSFLLDEGKEEQSRQDQQRLAGDCFGWFRTTREPERDVIHRRAEALEEPPGDTLTIERPIDDPCQ